jgi:TusA-related sulfurtransferase
MNDALPGEGVEIFVGDEATKNDVEVWVKKTGNRLLVNEHLGDKFRIVVQKVR